MGIDIDIVLVIFTVCAPAGAVGYALTVLYGLVKEVGGAWDREAQSTMARPAVPSWERWLALPIWVCVAGLVASATHLGTPANALYTLMGFGRSPLSNEIAAALMFVACSWAQWLTAFVRLLPRIVDRVWLLESSVAALWLVSRIAVVYSVSTIPTWDIAWVPGILWAQAFAGGASVCAATLGCARIELPAVVAQALAGAALVGVGVGCVLMGLEYEGLLAIRDSYGMAADLVPGFWWHVAGFGAGGALAVAGMLLGHRRPVARARRWYVASAALMLAAVACARVPFYAMHMTAGL